MKKIIISILLLFGLFLSSFAQNFDATSLSMGKAYSAVARGIDAVSWNPAALALPREKPVEFNVFSINVNMANSSLNFNNYNRYFTKEGHNDTLTDKDKKNFLNLISDDGLKIYGDANFNLFGFAAGYFAFSVRGVSNVQASLPKTAFKLALYGNESVENIYRFRDIDGQGFAAFQTTFSASYPIEFRKYFKNLAIGTNISYYSGMLYAEILKADASFYTNSDTLNTYFEFLSRSSTGGSGIGLDLGFAAELYNDLNISLNIKNVIGSIRWNKNTEERFIKTKLDSVKLSFDDDIESEEDDSTRSISAFSTSLPTIIHIGTAYKINDQWLISVDLEQAFSQKMGYSDQGLLSVGGQYTPIPQIPIRTGMTFGGKWGYLWGMGVGFHLGIFHLDLGYSMHRAVLPARSRGSSVALGMKFAF